MLTVALETAYGQVQLYDLVYNLIHRLFELCCFEHNSVHVLTMMLCCLINGMPFCSTKR